MYVQCFVNRWKQWNALALVIFIREKGMEERGGK